MIITHITHHNTPHDEGINCHEAIKLFHWFPWERADFCETYSAIVNDMLSQLLKSCQGSEKLTVQDQINMVHDDIFGCMLKATRVTEVISGIVTGSGVSRRRKI